MQAINFKQSEFGDIGLHSFLVNYIKHYIALLSISLSDASTV